MLPKNQEMEGSSNLVDEELKQPQGETQSGSLNKPSIVTGIIFFVVIITWTFLKIEDFPSQPKLLASCSMWSNTIRIVEIETQQEFANFDGVKLNIKGIFQLFDSDLSLATIH